MGSYLKMGLTLMAFAAVVAILLSAVYTITEEPIAKAELNVKLESIKNVLTDPISGELLIAEKDIPESQEKLEGMIWKKTDEDKLFTSSQYNGYCSSPAYKFSLKDGRDAYVITGASVGYGGYVTIMCSFVGNASTMEMLRMEVLDYSQETPGLGAKIADEPMKARFFDVPNTALKDTLKVDKDAGVAPAQTEAQIKTYKDEGVIFISDIMTGATITPRGVANAINAMYDYLEKELGGE